MTPSVVTLHDGQEARCYRADEVVELGALERVRRVPSPIPNPDQPEVALAVVALNASHGRRRVLHGLTFDLRPSTSLAIGGESGSGKTTLARCIVGLHRPATGEVRLRGELLSFDARRRTKSQRQEVQIVFQNPDSSLNPRRTVEELLRRPLELFLGLDRSAARARVSELLQQVALSETLRNRYAHELSGGEQQRVAIARALAPEPAILVCDEVTSSLDVSVQASIVELLQRLRSQLGLTMIFITHNLALIPLVAESLLVMKDGSIIESGPSFDVLEHPQDDYTRQLLESSPRIPEGKMSRQFSTHKEA
jgi:peptide/nickel transport system ATP-binding protein